MGFKAKFTKEDIQRRYDRFLRQIEKQQIRILLDLGEKCVEHARNIPPEQGFTDRTGNLRSSIGYVLFNDGEPILDNFVSMRGATTGVDKGKQIAQNAAVRHPSGLCLVVVAGMDYAIHVEAKGRDVLTSAETLAKRELPRMINDLIDSINKQL